MPTVAEVVSLLADRTVPERAAPWDPVGLQLGDPEGSVEKIGVCHEVSESVVSAVEEGRVDLLVTYHPLLFDPIRRVVSGRSPGGRARRLLVCGTSLLVTHTDFDSVEGGMADSLATALGLTTVEPFGDDDEAGFPAIGRVGSFQGSMADLIGLVKSRLGETGLRVSTSPANRTGRVAVVPGSGSDLIGMAASLADVLVTGDVSHHRAVSALDLGLAIIDPGHIGTERPGMDALVKLVTDVAGVPVVDMRHLDPETWS